MAAAISAACVSSAKCPVSKKRTTASGMSRLNASAPGGRKNGSFLPHTASKRRLVGAEILLEGRVERDVALVVAEQVELHLVRAGPGEIEIVERVAVRRDPRRVGDAVRVLPDGRLRLEESAQRLAVGRRRVLPIGPDRIPAVAQALLVGVAVLRDDRGDPLRMLDREPEPGRRAVVEHIDGVAVEADDLGEAVDRRPRSGRTCAPLSGISELPKPGRSGATMWKRSASSGIRSRNMWPAVGKPCSSSSFGAPGAPASR